MKAKPNNKKLRQDIKILLIRKEMEGCQNFLASEIKCNRNSLCMALSGYRSGPESIRILKRLKAYLVKL